MEPCNSPLDEKRLQFHFELISISRKSCFAQDPCHAASFSPSGKALALGGEVPGYCSCSSAELWIGRISGALGSRSIPCGLKSCLFAPKIGNSPIEPANSLRLWAIRLVGPFMSPGVVRLGESWAHRWLECGCEAEDQPQHVLHARCFDRDERRAARARLARLPGAAALLAKERARQDWESDDEPRNI